MSNSYDQIATVEIEIATAVVDTTSFDNILIVGALPAVAPSTAPEAVGVYTRIEAVEEAGWVTSGASADIVGVAAKIAFSQKPAPSKVYIAPIQVTTVENVDTAESALDTVKRALNVSGWYVVCPVGVSNSELASIAAYLEDEEKIMLYTDTTFFGSSGKTANTPQLGNTYNRTGAVFGKTSADQADASVTIDNKCANVATACSWLNYQSGSETAAFKPIIGIEPGEFSKTQVDALNTGNCTYITEIGGRKMTMVGKVLSGEWLDIIRFRDWLKNDMQVAVAKIFMDTPKVPFTDNGIALVQNAMEASLRRGQENGGITEDEYDDDGNETRGFEVTVPRANSIPDEERANRQLKRCSFRARLAGAIHFAEINGTVAYSL